MNTLCRRAVWVWLLSLSVFAGGLNAQQRGQVPATLDEDVSELEATYEAVRSGPVDRAVLDKLADLKLRLSERGVPGKSAQAERKRLAKAWKLAAAISREVEGDTDLVVEYYRIASELDPEDEESALEFKHRQRKLDAVNERLDEARRLREAAEKKQ